MTQSLLLFDTDRIKSYVFATDKLREIRAASAILDRLNRQEMPDALVGKAPQTIFANGGSGLFVVETDRIEGIKQAIKAAYRAQTATASVTGVELELPGPADPDLDISLSLKTLGYRLRAAKDGQQSEQTLLTHPYFNFCSSCGLEYAAHFDSENGREVLLCPSCWVKRDTDKQIRGKHKKAGTIPDLIKAVRQGEIFDQEDGLWPYLITRLHQANYDGLEGYDRPETFTDLAKLSSPQDYIGLIYADGDAMGQQIDQIKTLRQMQAFAKAVDESVYAATVEAICAHLRPKGGDESWPFDILLVGGDDLVMVTRAESALEVGLKVMARFTELTQAYSHAYDSPPLHLSVGVAIAHANYPFGQLLRLGESALKFAKKQAAKRRQAQPDWHEGLLNFLVVSSANHLEFERFYQEQLQAKAEFTAKKKNLYRSLRPYSANEFARLIAAVRQLKQMNTPRSKLEQLRALLFQNRRQAMVDSLSLLFHWRSDRQRGAIQEIVSMFGDQESPSGLLFPWFQKGRTEAEARFYTPLLDLVEIYDFITTQEAADGSGN